jgi:hypothetical protein
MDAEARKRLEEWAKDLHEGFERLASPEAEANREQCARDLSALLDALDAAEKEAADLRTFNQQIIGNVQALMRDQTTAAAAGGRRELPESIEYLEPFADEQGELPACYQKRDAAVALYASDFTPDELRAVADDLERRKAGAQT